MQLKLEEVKATLIRLQGQMDVWNNIYQVMMQENLKKEEAAKNDTVKEGQ